MRQTGEPLTKDERREAWRRNCPKAEQGGRWVRRLGCARPQPAAHAVEPKTTTPAQPQLDARARNTTHASANTNTTGLAVECGDDTWRHAGAHEAARTGGISQHLRSRSRSSTPHAQSSTRRHAAGQLEDTRNTSHTVANVDTGARLG